MKTAQLLIFALLASGIAISSAFAQVAVGVGGPNLPSQGSVILNCNKPLTRVSRWSLRSHMLSGKQGEGRVMPGLRLRDCFAQYGIDVGTYPRRVWSAVSPDGKAVLTLWTDQFDDPDMTQYSTFGKRLPRWQHRRENKLRVEQLTAVGVGGTFESIIQTSTDPDAQPRRARSRRLGPTMRLLALDPETGEFRAEVIQHA